MIHIRPIHWPDDITALRDLDTSFTTDRIYRVEQDGLGFRLIEETVVPTFGKRYPFNPAKEQERALWDHAMVAERDGAVVGFAAAHFSKWNMRAELQHLYVDNKWRNQGIGKMLLDSVRSYAKVGAARCIWVETQNVNLPAVKFYLSQGFTLCGLDQSLYDQDDSLSPEVAVFLESAI